VYRPQRALVAIVLLTTVTAAPAGLAGCGRTPAAGGEPEVKTRLTQVLRLYNAYVEKNKKAPSSEQALREFGQKLTAPEREGYLLEADFESIFTSPRDNQKFIVAYNRLAGPAVNRGIAWEATGKDGTRFVALSMGYVEEYDAETAKQYAK
jgi:hypothetical protein